MMLKQIPDCRPIILFMLIISMFQPEANGQRQSLRTLVNVGLSTPFLDKGIGLHLGLNPSIPLFPFLSVEGQVSYLYTQTTSSFISGKKGQSHSLNFLAGGRLYLHRKERKNRLYMNGLIGGNYLKEKLDGQRYIEEFNTGISLGAFYEMKRIVIGLSLESPQNLIMKAGIII